MQYFYFDSNIQPFRDQFYKVMLIFFVIDRDCNKSTHKDINKSYMA